MKTYPILFAAQHQHISMRQVSVTLVFALGLAVSSLGAVKTAWAEPEKQSEEQLVKAQSAIESSIKDSAASQKRITKNDSKTRSLLEEYRGVIRQSQLFQADAELMQARVDEQNKRLAELSAAEVKITDLKRELTPLLNRLIVQLEQFIQLDLPFKQGERLEAVAYLRSIMVDPSLSDAERFRIIVEAWQTEIDYGYELDTWRAILDDGNRRMVTYFRIGRVGLYYRGLDGQDSGFWNASKDRWEGVDIDSARSIQTGIRMAQNQAAPDLLTLPIPAPTESTNQNASLNTTEPNNTEEGVQ